MSAERRAESASPGRETSARQRQPAASHAPERSPQLASDLLRRGAAAPAGLAATLAAADVATRAEAVAGLQRSHGNVAVQRLLAVQRQDVAGEAEAWGSACSDTAAVSSIGYAVPEEYYSGGVAGSAGGSASFNPFSRLWNGAMDARDAWRTGKSNAIGEGVSAVSGAFSQYGSGARGAVNSLIGGFGDAGEALWNGVPGGGDSMAEDVLSRLGAAGTALGGGVGDAASSFGSGVVGAGSALWGGAENVAGSLWGGASSAAGEVGSAASDVWDYFTD
jgi:hypothetical protein